MYGLYQMKKKLVILFVTAIILAITVLCGVKIKKNVREIYREYSYSTVKSHVYERINVTTDKIVVQNHESEPLVAFTTDENGKVSHVRPDVNAVNILSNLIAVECQKDLETSPVKDISLRYGAFSGSPLLTNVGREIKIPLIVHYTVKSDFRDYLESIGINVVRYAMYLEITTQAKITLPQNEYEAEFVTYVLIGEHVFSTDIPNTYISSKEDLQYLDLLP